MKLFTIRNVDGSLDLDRLLCFVCLFVLLIFGIFFAYNAVSRVVDSHTFAKSGVRPDVADDKVKRSLNIQAVSASVTTRQRNTVVCMQNNSFGFYKDPWGGIASIEAKKYAVPFGGSEIQFSFYNFPVNNPLLNTSPFHLRMGTDSDGESSAGLSLLLIK